MKIMYSSNFPSALRKELLSSNHKTYNNKPGVEKREF